MHARFDPHIVTISGPQTIREIALAHETLVSALADHVDVAVDCEQVTEVDPSFVQLLLAGRRSAVANGRSFALFRSPEGALQAALLRGGFLSDGKAMVEPDAVFWSADRGAA